VATWLLLHATRRDEALGASGGLWWL